MPSIDADTGSLTLRIVYDGLPLAGKTTSVRALSQRIRGTRGFTSPAEADGRTLYFDWLEFVGGEFGGREIHVQVTSVPGQVELRHRRAYLLDQADAIVFVADTRTDAMHGCLELFAEVARVANERAPAVGVVFQANKRDSSDAWSLDALRAALNRHGRISIVDTVATEGDGVGEAFAIATRLALDRTHAMLTRGELVSHSVTVRSATELLNQLQALEKSSIEMIQASATGPAATLEEEIPYTSQTALVSDRETVFSPDVRLPVGHIWPPVEGRALVLEASQSGVVPTRSGAGDWWASTAGWRFHSDRLAVFDDVNVGRAQLVEWARRHALCGTFLSRDRALLLASAGRRNFRLWQLVRVSPSLRERFLGEMPSARDFARRLYEVARILGKARETVEALNVHLRCSLWTIGETDEKSPTFVGLMPSLGERARRESNLREVFERELLPIVRTFTMTGHGREVMEYLEAQQDELATELLGVVASLGRRSPRG
jgi:signal recognition particle receptor subunit beta